MNDEADTNLYRCFFLIDLNINIFRHYLVASIDIVVVPVILDFMALGDACCHALPYKLSEGK